MGWQKTFTLARRSKGCHLVTDEVLGQIEPGLRGVQVIISFLSVSVVTVSAPRRCVFLELLDPQASLLPYGLRVMTDPSVV